MMNTNTLLALLLGLQNAEPEFTEDTKSSLRQLGRLIQFDSDWEDIQEQLDTLLENNTALNQAYQAAKAALDMLERNLLRELLPTQAELELATSAEDDRGYIPGKDDGESNEIINMMMLVINHDEPVKISKTLLQRLTEFLKLKRNKDKA